MRQPVQLEGVGPQAGLPATTELPPGTFVRPVNWALVAMLLDWLMDSASLEVGLVLRLASLVELVLVPAYPEALPRLILAGLLKSVAAIQSGREQLAAAAAVAAAAAGLPSQIA